MNVSDERRTRIAKDEEFLVDDVVDGETRRDEEDEATISRRNRSIENEERRSPNEFDGETFGSRRANERHRENNPISSPRRA